MKEEYKTCPNCHNMVDKKDKQCPYCLTSLTRRSMWNSSNKTNTSNTREIRDNTSTDEEYSSDTENYNENNDTIRDDKQQKGNWIYNTFWKTSVLELLIENWKTIWRWNRKEIENKIINKARNIIIIICAITFFLPFVIEIIKRILWK